MKTRIVELISVGTELLLGNIINTNSAYLSEKCAQLGLSCFYQDVVGDNAGRLEETIRLALSRADIVMISGGLGPTEDDLTKETAAAVLGRRLLMHEKSREAIQTYFDRKGMEVTDNNWKQAMMPEDCVVVDNPNGTAPGVIMEDHGRYVILMPGPPNEMVPMFENFIMPYLQKQQTEIIYSETVKLCGTGEGKAEMLLRDLIDVQENPTIATYAKTGEVHLRVTARAESEERAKEMVVPMVEELKRRFGTLVYTTKENVTLEQAVAELLRQNRDTICTAESCTGGMLAARLINVPGISEVYQAGFITYANEAKQKELEVSEETLRLHGAVSRETAEAMARGAAKRAGADVALATTGIAGPDGGTEEKPVGLVYLACFAYGTVTVRECRFGGNRAKIRESAVAAALTLARECILQSR